MSRHFPPALFVAFTFLIAACSSDAEQEPAASPSASAQAIAGASVERDSPHVAVPDRPLESMDLAEDYSEEVADRMVEFGDKLRRRDFAACEEWIAEGFVGSGLFGLDVAEESALPIDTRKVVYDPASAQSVDRSGFLESLAAWLSPWQGVDSAIWKVKGAEFQAGADTWGRVRFRLTVLGLDREGGPTALTIWGHGRMAKRGGEWLMEAFELESLDTVSRAQPLFRDVATSTGLAHVGIRFGQPGNTSFAWNGAASGDIDGDGRFDLFVPSQPRNFLYRATAEDGFREEASARGLDDSGGTGAVFFDHDNDGDQDLALGDVGWLSADGTLRGNRLRFYVNDGEARFAEKGTDLGFDAISKAYSLVVLDSDLDGHLDVFVCNYGRVEDEPNNSWIEATNGTPNALFRNKGGTGFEQVAEQVGLVDASWSYAAAAADYDADGDLDLYVANDYGRNSLWNNTAGEFEDVAAELGVRDLGNGMGAAFGDLDCDGDLDLYVSNMSSTAGNRILRRLSESSGTRDLLKMAAGNSIFLASGDTFERLDPKLGGIGASWAWAPALFDLDLDGRLDIYCASGFVTGDTLADT